MAVIRCKLTKNGKSITSAEIEFESGDTIQFEAGQHPHFAGGAAEELSVHVEEAMLHLSLHELPNKHHHKRKPDTPTMFLVVGPDPGATPTNPNLPPPPPNKPAKHLSAVLVPDGSATASDPGAKSTTA
jgi:hypothetical protein